MYHLYRWFIWNFQHVANEKYKYGREIHTFLLRLKFGIRHAFVIVYVRRTYVCALWIAIVLFMLACMCEYEFVCCVRACNDVCFRFNMRWLSLAAVNKWFDLYRSVQSVQISFCCLWYVFPFSEHCKQKTPARKTDLMKYVLLTLSLSHTLFCHLSFLVLFTFAKHL